MPKCETCGHYEGGICNNRDSDRWQEHTEPVEMCLDYEPNGGKHIKYE